MYQFTQEQFEHYLNLLILYKQFNPDTVVYLNMTSIKESLHFMNSKGKDIASKLTEAGGE
jgi:hypothetical protein